MDPILVSMALPRETCYLARDTLFRNPVFRRLITSLNAFPVRRSTADVSAIKESLRRLKQGYSLLLFPEGTRTPDGRVHPMHAGLTAIAKKARVPIVPILIDGMFQAWPRDCRLPRSGNVVVEYGRPIAPDEYADLSAEQLIELIRGRLIGLQEGWHDAVPRRRLPWYEVVRQPDR
jgi:1-acyl-sn-glycerol-3-phosphate acyltransferase